MNKNQVLLLLIRSIQLVLMLLILPLALKSQNAIKWKDHYDHYQGSYEDNYSCNTQFRRKEKKQVKQFPYGDYCGSINVTLSPNGVYQIYLEASKLNEDSLLRESYSFQGTYTVDSIGHITFNGSHPFASNQLRIKEYYARKNNVTFTINRSLIYKFSKEYVWIEKKRRSTYCDGCRLSPED